MSIEPETVAGGELGDRAEVDLQLVTGDDLADRTLVPLGFRAHGGRRARIDAATRAAVDFHVWRALAPLGGDDAAELAAVA